ncbi:MAG: hypothetical protein RJA63_875 [Pseudomonadota bacterium]|jgi:hypothetical protein
MPANLNAEQLALLRQLAAQLGPYQGDTSSGFGDGSSYSTGQNQSKWSSWDPSQAIKSYGVQMGPNGPVFAGDTGDGAGYVYDQNGNFVRAEDRNDGHVGLINGFLTTAALGSLASGLGTGVEGAATGGADSATSAAWSNGAGLGKDTLTSMGMNAGFTPTASGLSGAAALGGDMASGVNQMRAGEIANYSTNGTMPSSAAVQANPGLLEYISATGTQAGNALNGVLPSGAASTAADVALKAAGNGSTLGGLLGAGLGALSSKDQTTSSTKDPWAPAQDFIKQQIAQGQSLSNQYQARPFSDAQKTAYGNLASIINGANANAPNMSDFINRQMSGGTAYDPRDPYKNIGKGVSQIVGPGPSGLLNYFPGKGG